MRIPVMMVAVALTGCAATLPPPTPVPWDAHAPMMPQPVHVFLDRKLSDFTRQLATTAVEEWNIALQGRIHLQVVPYIPLSAYDTDTRNSSDILILGVESSHPMIARSHYSNAWAVTYPVGKAMPGALIYLATDKIRHPHDTILHELGHSLGAEDRETGGLLMTRTYSGISYIDTDAATQVAHHFH